MIEIKSARISSPEVHSPGLHARRAHGRVLRGSRFALSVFSVFLLIALIVTGSFPLGAVETAWTQERSVRLATGNDFSPFADENLPSGGLTTELIEHIFLKAGYAVDIDHIPWKRGYRDVLAHARSGTFPYYRTAEREAKFHFSAPLFETQGRIFVARDLGFDPRSAAEMGGLDFCRALGYSIPKQFKSFVNAGRIRVVETARPENSFRMLIAGRCDFVVWNDLIAAAVFKFVPGGRADLRQLDFNWKPSTMHFIVAKDHPRAQSLIKVVNEGLERLKDNGAYHRIVERHLVLD